MSSKGRSRFPDIATVDVLMGLVIALGVLLNITIISIRAETTAKNDRIKNSAAYLVRLNWAAESDDDVDLYVSDPNNHFVFFGRLQDGLLSLTRDDTGRVANTVRLPDGRLVQSAVNEETVEIRGIIEGEYAVNVHMYRKSGDDPTPVAVVLYKVAAGEDIKLHERALTLSRAQEETAFRFTVLKSGDVVDINQLPKRFVK